MIREYGSKKYLSMAQEGSLAESIDDIGDVVVSIDVEDEEGSSLFPICE
jgi:hypothetical protein